MSTVLISSLAGIHQNSNLNTGGGTDDTAVIQAALNAAGTGLTLIQDGVSLISGLDISSNTTLQCLPNCGFYLANSSNREMLRNKNRSGSSITDQNITVNGGYWNGNKSNQSGVSQSDHTPMAGFGFYGISNLTIKNLTVFNASAWGVGIGNYNGIAVTGCSFLASTAVSNLNTDGIDLRGPGTDATLSNITILSGDDAIALNARAYSSTVVGPFIAGGNISGATISNIALNSSCFSGIDLISDDTFTVSGVTISGVSGQVQNYALYFNLDGFNLPIPTHGGCSNISLSGMSVTQSGTPFGASEIPIGLYLVNCSTNGLSLGAGITDFLKLPASTEVEGGVAAGSITNLTVGRYARATSTPVVAPCTFGTLYGQSAQIPTSSSGSSMSVTLPGLTAAGSTIVVFATTFVTGGHTITGVSDGVNRYTRQANFNDGATGHTGEIWVAQNLSAGSRTIQVSLSSPQTGGTLEAAEYMFGSVESVSSIFFDTSSETTVTCPSATTVNIDDIVIGVGSVANTGVTGTGAGFTSRQIGVGAFGFLVDSYQPSIGTYTPSVTTAAQSGNYRGTIVLAQPLGSNWQSSNPVVITADTSVAATTNWRGANGGSAFTGGIGARPEKIVITVSGTIAAGNVVINEVESNGSTGPVLFQANIPAGFTTAEYDLTGTSAGWHDFIVTGLAATGTQMELHYRV